MRIPGLAIDAAAELPWIATRDRGVSWLPLHLDQPSARAASDDAPARAARHGARRGGAVVLIRMEPGCAYAAHRHVGTEDVLVLAGGYRDERGEHVQGDHVHYEAGSVHAPRALGDAHRPAGPDNPACVLFAVVPEGVELSGTGGRPTGGP